MAGVATALIYVHLTQGACLSRTAMTNRASHVVSLWQGFDQQRVNVHIFMVPGKEFVSSFGMVYLTRS